MYTVPVKRDDVLQSWQCNEVAFSARDNKRLTLLSQAIFRGKWKLF